MNGNDWMLHTNEESKNFLRSNFNRKKRADAMGSKFHFEHRTTHSCTKSFHRQKHRIQHRRIQRRLHTHTHQHKHAWTHERTRAMTEWQLRLTLTLRVRVALFSVAVVRIQPFYNSFVNERLVCISIRFKLDFRLFSEYEWRNGAIFRMIWWFIGIVNVNNVLLMRIDGEWNLNL